MNTFKVGDFVRCIYAYGSDLVEGRVYEVIGQLDGSYIAVQRSNGKEHCGWLASRFVYVDMTPPTDPPKSGRLMV